LEKENLDEQNISNLLTSFLDSELIRTAFEKLGNVYDVVQEWAVDALNVIEDWYRSTLDIFNNIKELFDSRNAILTANPNAAANPEADNVVSADEEQAEGITKLVGLIETSNQLLTGILNGSLDNTEADISREDEDKKQSKKKENTDSSLFGVLGGILGSFLDSELVKSAFEKLGKAYDVIKGWATDVLDFFREVFGGIADFFRGGAEARDQAAVDQARIQSYGYFNNAIQDIKGDIPNNLNNLLPDDRAEIQNRVNQIRYEAQEYKKRPEMQDPVQQEEFDKFIETSLQGIPQEFLNTDLSTYTPKEKIGLPSWLDFKIGGPSDSSAMTPLPSTPPTSGIENSAEPGVVYGVPGQRVYSGQVIRAAPETTSNQLLEQMDQNNNYNLANKTSSINQINMPVINNNTNVNNSSYSGGSSSTPRNNISPLVGIL